MLRRPVGGRPTDLVVVSHSGARAGAPMVLLRFLEWLKANTALDTRVVLLHGGSMESEFEQFDAHIIGGNQSRLWMLQRGFTNMGHPRAATALAYARQAPTMISASRAPLVFLNSAGSLPAVRFMPKRSESKLVLYLHELDESFDRTLGSRAWDLLSPRIDHFVTCSAQVTSMLTDRKGIAPELITEHPGFVEMREVEPVRREYLRRQLGIPLRATVVGGSGSLEWRKGPELFVRMAKRLYEQRPDLDPHFVWLGGPIDQSPGWKVQHDLDSAGLRGRLHLAGEVQKPEEVMALYDVFALTSREDPYPLAMIEAASLGVPMVSFDNGGATQFSQEGSGPPLATVVPYLDVAAMTDAVVHLLDHPRERHELGQRARDYVAANRSTDRAAPRLLQTLVDVEPALGQQARTEPSRSPRSPSNGSVVGSDRPHPGFPGPKRPAEVDEVILVDATDRESGTSGKLDAHRPPGQLHRALSVFLLRDDGRIVLQRRALAKYHFAGLWSNSCCTHPRPGETVVAAGERRLHEELGIRSTLREVGCFTYRATDPVSGLVEYEFDHVLVGTSPDSPVPDPGEVSETTEMTIAELKRSIVRTPGEYTPWLADALHVLASKVDDHAPSDTGELLRP